MCVSSLICLLNISISLHVTLPAAAHLAEGQFFRTTENWLKLLMLQDGTLRLLLSIKEEQNLNPNKTWKKK
jgi:hypothetical protein